MNKMFSAIINQKKTRYVIMDEIVPDISGRINLYIDLRSVFSQFWSGRFDDATLLSNFTYTDIIAEVVNVAGHYCGYFIKNQLPVDYLNCFIIYSDKLPTKKLEIFPEYKKSFNEHRNGKTSVVARFNEKFTKCLEVLPEVLRNIPRIFFINSGDIDTYDIPKGFIKSSNNVSHIIFSNDPQFLPYISKTCRTGVMTMKSDKSMFLTGRNVYDYLTEFNKITQENFNLGASHILPLLCLTGNKKNDVSGVGRIGYTNGSKFLNNLVNAGIIPKKGLLLLSDYQKLISEFNKEFGLDEDKLKIFERNWKLFTCRKEEVSFTIPEKTFIMNQLDKSEDFDTYMDFNHKEFRNNPLDLDFMFQYGR